MFSFALFWKEDFFTVTFVLWLCQQSFDRLQPISVITRVPGNTKTTEMLILPAGAHLQWHLIGPFFFCAGGLRPLQLAKKTTC